MTWTSLLWNSIPLVVIAAISPIVFVNASRVTNEAGPAGGVRFAAGAAAVLLVLGAAAMGLVGAAATSLASRGLASRWVDAVLGVLLVAYGLGQLRRRRGVDTAERGTVEHRAIAFGALSMATNFTTLPIFVALAQRLGAVGAPAWARILALVALVAAVTVPAWLPAVITVAAPGRGRMSPRTRARIVGTTRAISIGACLLGGLLILLHAVLA